MSIDLTAFDESAAWFAAYCRGRATGDARLTARALAELRRLGVHVSFEQPCTQPGGLAGAAGGHRGG